MKFKLTLLFIILGYFIPQAQETFPKNGVENFYPDKAHPGIIGHKAYALSAIEVLNEIEDFNK